MIDSSSDLDVATATLRDLRQIPTRQLVTLHNDSAEGGRPLPPAVMASVCEAMRERIQYCGCDREGENVTNDPQEKPMTRLTEAMEAMAPDTKTITQGVLALADVAVGTAHALTLMAVRLDGMEERLRILERRADGEDLRTREGRDG